MPVDINPPVAYFDLERPVAYIKPPVAYFHLRKWGDKSLFNKKARFVMKLHYKSSPKYGVGKKVFTDRSCLFLF